MKLSQKNEKQGKRILEWLHEAGEASGYTLENGGRRWVNCRDGYNF